MENSNILQFGAFLHWNYFATDKVCEIQTKAMIAQGGRAYFYLEEGPLYWNRKPIWQLGVKGE